MKQINLLPAGVRRRQSRQRLVSLTVLAGILGVVAVGAIWLSLSLDLASTQDQLSRLQASQAQSAKAAQAAVAAGLDADTLARIKQLNTFSQTEINWVRALTLAGAIIPRDIRLTTYSYATAASGLSLKMSGEAPSNLSFADFVQSLQGNPALQAPKVDGYSFTPGKGTVTFSVSATVPVTQVNYLTSK